MTSPPHRTRPWCAASQPPPPTQGEPSIGHLLMSTVDIYYLLSSAHIYYQLYLYYCRLLEKFSKIYVIANQQLVHQGSPSGDVIFFFL